MNNADAKPEKRSWHSSPWFASILLSFIAALFYSDRTAFTTLFPLLRNDLGFSDMGLAAINTFYLWSFALASPLAGFLGDRFSRRSLILVSIFFWSVITMVSSVVTSSTQLLALRILLGLTECLFVPNAVALLGEYHPVRSRALAMGLFVSGINLGLVAGGTFAGGLGESYGWRSAILALGFTGLPVLGISYALLKGNLHRTEQRPLPDSHATPIWSSLGEVMKIPSFWVLTLGGIFLNFGVMGVFELAAALFSGKLPYGAGCFRFFSKCLHNIGSSSWHAGWWIPFRLGHETWAPPSTPTGSPLDWGLLPVPSVLCFLKPFVLNFPVHFCFYVVSLHGGSQCDSPLL